MNPTIFITYSSKDEKVSRIICTALENRGLACWISSRNVKPGQNYQEQIVKAIRAAKIMVLVFTANANNSNEIKKELALASQNNLVVIPVRIEDVTPNEAFAYEFATRQWVDLFDDWENSIARLVELIAASIDDPSLTGNAAAPSFGKTHPASFIRRSGARWAMLSGIAVIAAAVIGYEVVTLPQQPASTTVIRESPTQLEPRAVVASPAPSPPQALAHQQPQSPVQATSLAPGEPVTKAQQAQPLTPLTAPNPSQPVASATVAPPPPPVSSSAPAIVQPSSNEAERAWAVTKDTTSPAVLQAFIKQFGTTIYGNMARARLVELKKSQVAVIGPTTPSSPAPAAKATQASCSGAVGTWSWLGGGVTVLNKDGSARNTINSGTWTCAGSTMIISWVNGVVDRMTFSQDGDSLLVSSTWLDSKFTANRMK